MTTQLVLVPHPLTLEGRTITRGVQLLPGETLADFLYRAEVDLSEPDWVVSIGGMEVPAVLWSRTRPKHGQIIECRRRPGRDVLRVVALAVLTYWTFGAGAVGTAGAPGWAAGGGFGTFLAQSAVFMVGAAVINRVLAPPRERLNTYDQSTGSTYSLNGGRNRARPYEPLGLLFGQTKVIPDYAALPYSWFDGDQQYQSVRFSAGLNCAAVDSVKIGQTPIGDYADVVQMRTGFPSGNSTNVDWTNVDTVDGATLTAPTAPGAWVTRTSSTDSVYLAVDFVASLYAMGDDGGMTTATLQIDIETRALPSGTWVTEFPLTLTSRTTQPVRKTRTLGVAGPGQYEVRCRKHDVDVATTRASNSVEWVSLKSYQADAADYTQYPQYGIRIRASGQLNGVLDELSWVATAGDAPVWNGSAFVVGPTRNPGAQMLQFARGIFDGTGRRQAGMGYDDGRIDLDALKAFTLHCAANGYTFDHWFDRALSCMDTLEAMAAVGLGTVSQHTGKLGVVWLAPGQPIEAVVNMANIKAGSFKVDYATREFADELEVSYFDRDDSFKPKSVRLLAPGVTVPRETARLAPAGVQTEAAAVRTARLTMGQNIFGRKAVTWEMDLEHMAFHRYSLVALSHDLTQWGHGGRVQAASRVGDIVTLTLDAPVPAGSVRYMGLRIPGETGYRVFSVDAFSGESHVVTLSNPWPGDAAVPGDSAGNPAHDTIWIYDFEAEPGLRLRVTSIEPSADMKGARITASPEPDEFWTYMATGAYTVSGSPAPRVPVEVSNLRVTQRRLDLNYANGTELSLTFDATGPWAEAQVWGAPDGDELQLLGTTLVPRFGPILVGNDGIYVLQVRPFDELGRLGTVASVAYNVTLGSVVGVNSSRVFIYQRAASSPTLPSTTSTFTFSTGVITGLDNGWSGTIATGDDPLWVSAATAIGTAGTDAIPPSAWSTPAILASNGATARLLTLVSTATTFTFDAAGPYPTSQTITFNALLANLTGTATFSCTRYDGSNTSLGTVTLGGSGNTRTLTVAQFGDAVYAVVQATLSGQTVQITVNRVGPAAARPTTFSDTAWADLVGNVTAIARIRLNTDGTTETYDGVSWTAGGNWFTPTTAGIGSSFRVRGSDISGQVSNVGSFLSLSSSRQFSLTQTPPPPSNYVEKVAEPTFIIASNSSDVALVTCFGFMRASVDRT